MFPYILLRDERGFKSLSTSAAVCLSVLLYCTLLPTFSEGQLEPMEVGIGFAAQEPSIKPCLIEDRCPADGGSASWWFCTAGQKANGCKSNRPFTKDDCTAQCTRGATATAVRSYEIFQISGAAGEPSVNNPFITVPTGGRLKQICIDRCDGARQFNSTSSLRKNARTYLHLEKAIPGTERSSGWYSYVQVDPLPIGQSFAVPDDELPSICFENLEFGTDAYNRQLQICQKDIREYPTNGCTKQCYENDGSLRLAPGDRIVFRVYVDPIPGDYFRLTNLGISLYSEVQDECKVATKKTRGRYTTYRDMVWSDDTFTQGLKVAFPEGFARPQDQDFVEVSGCEKEGVLNVKYLVNFGNKLRWNTCESFITTGKYSVNTVAGKQVEQVEQSSDNVKPYKVLTFANSVGPNTGFGIPKPGDSVQVQGSRCAGQADLSLITVLAWEKI